MQLKKFQQELIKNKIDAALFFINDLEKKEPNLIYFSGMDLETSALLIPKNKPYSFYVPLMEKDRIKKHGLLKKIATIKKKKLFEQIKHKIPRAKTIGLNYETISMSEYKLIRKYFKKTRFKDISKICRQLRQLKTEAEISIIKKGIKIADNIIQETINNFKKFKTEADVKKFLAKKTLENNCVFSFPPIVASGKNAALPHYEPLDKKLNKGFCVIDFGLRYKNYCTDITRTIYLGKPKKQDKEIYNFLLNAQKDTINHIKEGMKCEDIYNYTRKLLKNYKKYFTHGLGHGIGTEIHELPNLSLNSKDKVKNGMVFTIEPGIYIKNKLGMRIEDDILFKNKPVVLTKTSKELEVIR